MKKRKVIPKTQREISEGTHTPYSVDGMNGGVLQNPNDSDYDKENRGNHLSYKGDTTKPFSISLMDVDEAVLYYLENIIKPSVVQNNIKINVPILYGTSERWKQIQKDGFLKDGRNQTMLPLIIFTRTNITPDKSLTNKVDANGPNNYGVFSKTYNKKNAYDNFSLLTNRKPEKEYHAVVIPDYVTVTYDFIISTNFVEQMNSIIESINYTSDSYWGDPEKFKFKANIDSFVNSIQLPADGQRIVKTTFTLKLHGHIVPQILQKDLNSIKKFNNKTQMIFGLEMTQPYESLIPKTVPSFVQGNSVFPGNEACAPVTITQNGVFYRYQAAGTTFNYDTGSGNPIDIQINSQSFLTGVSNNQNIGIYNNYLNPVGYDDGGYWMIDNSLLYVNGNYYTQSIPEQSYDIIIKNTALSSSGFISGSLIKIRDTNLKVNNIQITGARAETTKSISIVDTVNLDPIGTILQDTPTLLTIGIRNTYISNSNGTYTQSITPESSASIPNSHIKIYDWSGSLITSSNIISCVTSSITLSQSIGYIRPVATGTTASYLNYDEYWNWLNDPDTYIIPTAARLAVLESKSIHLLQNNNIFGHKWRMTGISGGYYDINTAEYKLADGTVSDVNTTFGTAAATSSYIIDHHTGLGWKWNIQGSSIWATHASASISMSHYGYSDWYLPNVNEVFSLNNFTLNLITTFPPFNSINSLKSSTPYPGLESTQHYHKTNFSLGNRADLSADGAYYCRRHFV